MPVKILCLKWGTKFGPEYVNNLYAGIRRNTTVPFEFRCFTDDPSKLNPAVITHPLPFNTLEGWWNKLYLFSKELPFARGDSIFFFDLDTLVISNIDHFLKYKPSQLTVLRDFYTGLARSIQGRDNIGSGLMAWRHGDYSKIWEEFARDPESAIRSVYPHGDQRWIQKHALPRRYWQDVLPHTVVSFKVHCLQGPPPNAAIVCYHGRPAVHESPTARFKDWIFQVTPQPWVLDHWHSGTTPPKPQIRVEQRREQPTPAPAIHSTRSTPTVKTYFAMVPARQIFGSVGRCGGGHNTVWEDWSTVGRRARANIIREFEEGINQICGHYTKLEASMLAEGMRNPLIITCGQPLRRTLNHLPPELRSMDQSRWLLLEGTAGGSRLWVAQKHDMVIPCFVNDRTGRFAGAEAITTVEQALAKYQDPPAQLVINPKQGLTEAFDQRKIGYHLGVEWSEDRIVQERAPMWVRTMNRYGYYVDRLTPGVIRMLADAGVVQPENLKKRLTAQ